MITFSQSLQGPRGQTLQVSTQCLENWCCPTCILQLTQIACLLQTVGLEGSLAITYLPNLSSVYGEPFALTSLNGFLYPNMAPAPSHPHPISTSLGSLQYFSPIILPVCHLVQVSGPLRGRRKSERLAISKTYWQRAELIMAGAQ